MQPSLWVSFCVFVALLERKQFGQYLKVLLSAALGFIGFYLLLLRPDGISSD